MASSDRVSPRKGKGLRRELSNHATGNLSVDGIMFFLFCFFFILPHNTVGTFKRLKRTLASRNLWTASIVLSTVGVGLRPVRSKLTETVA